MNLPAPWRPFCAALFICFALSALPSQAASPPNIVLIMADDIGFSDLGCYGGEIETPRLDKLAHDGLRFTQFYNTARCCPTRASLLTGLYPHQAGLGHMTDGAYSPLMHPGYARGLNDRCRTIAEVLKEADYATYMSGKWHVTQYVAPNGPRDNWPRQRGFDKFYGTITGAGSFYDPACLCRDNSYITPENDPKYQPETFYYTDAIADNAVMFLEEHAEADTDRPFFLYVAFTCPHWPMHALPEDIAKYEGKYDDGYAPIREARFARSKELGLIDPQWELSEQAGNWENQQHKAWEARCMEVYAAMIDRMDQNIGKIVDQLEASGELENTLVFYLQDNGGCAEGVGRQPQALPEPRQPFAADELQTDIQPRFTRDGSLVRKGPQAMPGPADTYIAYGRNWANVSNTPFREYKHWVHEGGISSPLIVHWPAAISPDQRGKLVSTPGHLIDIMATCVDVAGADYPKEVDGRPITPLGGISLAPEFAGETAKRGQPIFWEHEANGAVRDGQWKLVRYGNQRTGETQPWELYDMQADRTEQHNLASQHPDRVKQMAAQWDEWAKRANVLPWPWGAKK